MSLSRLVLKNVEVSLGENRKVRDFNIIEKMLKTIRCFVSRKLRVGDGVLEEWTKI